MDKLPVLFMTKETPGRENVAKRTIEALTYNLLPQQFPLKFYFAASGSSEYKQALVHELLRNSGCTYDIIHGEDGESAGSLWNRAINKIFSDGHTIYYRSEDDFLLKGNLEILHFVELLEDEKENVGMVRLGLMPINLKLYSVGWYDSHGQGHIFFDCLPTSPYAYSGNPGLVHKRLHDAVGYFHDGKNPGDIEIDFDGRIRAKMEYGGPRIWYPLELGKFGTYGPFDHIGDVKSY